MPEETTETPQPTLPVEQKSTDWTKIILAAIVGFGLLAGSAYAGYYYGTQQVPQSEELTPVVSQPTPTPTPTPESTTPPVTDPTAGWEMYASQIHNYTVRVPEDWEIQEGNFLGISGEVGFTPPSEKDKGLRTDIHITAMKTEKVRYSLNTQEEFDEWLTKEASKGEGERLFKIDNIEIGGIEAVKFISRSLPGDGTTAFYSVVTWFRRDGVNYYIELGGFEEIVTGLTTLYDQILPTFKFLD